MERIDHFILWTSIALLMLGILMPLNIVNNTVRFMILCLPFSLLSYFIQERKARRILSLAALLIMTLVAILGFGFSYFQIGN